MPPLISVLVPTYNAERWLPRTLPTVLGQTLDDFELLVSDNCSEDGTVSVVEEFARCDSRVRLIRQSRNLGLRGNCEALVEEAGGTYVKLLMADDVLYPTALERLSAGLTQPGVALATARRTRIDVDGNLLPDEWWTGPLTETPQLLNGRGLADAVLEHQVNLIGEPSVTLFRRSQVEATKMFTVGAQRFGTILDVVAWVRLLTIGHLFYEPESLSGYTQHDGQTGRIPANRVLEAIEWWSLLEAAPRLGLLADPERRARALTTYLRRWSQSVPLDQPPEGMGAIARALARCAAELATLHDQLGARSSAEFEAYRLRAQGPDPTLVGSAAQ